MNQRHRCKRNLAVPTLAVGFLLGLAGACQAQTFTFTSSNNAAGMNGGTTVSSPNTATITGTGDASASFLDQPGSNAVPQTAPTDIRIFTITPQGTSGSATFNDTFDITVNITSNGSTVPFVFSGINLSGTLNDNVPRSDTVVFSSIPFTPVTHTVGGSSFTLTINGVTPPGTSGGATPDGTLSAGVTSTPAATPEPGSLAMLIGMSVSGGAFFLRRRARKSA